MGAFGAASERERLGRSLGRLRAVTGLSQPQIARQLGWSQPKVSRVEAGKQRVTLPEVDRWCRVTGASDQQRQELLVLVRLEEIVNRPNIDLRVLPMAPAPVWRTSGFVLFDGLADQEPFVHLELLIRPLNIDEPGQVDTYRRAFGRLQAASAAGERGKELIARVRRETRQGSASAGSAPPSANGRS